MTTGKGMDQMSKDTRPWITIYPDYPRAFAWFLRPCDESELESYLGPNCGDLYPLKGSGCFEDVELPTWLAQRFCVWMDKWEELEERNSGTSMYEDHVTDEERAIDDEGIALTRELKKLYGDKYRFRYSYAWRWILPSEKGWLIV